MVLCIMEPRVRFITTLFLARNQGQDKTHIVQEFIQLWDTLLHGVVLQGTDVLQDSTSMLVSVDKLRVKKVQDMCVAKINILM